MNLSSRVWESRVWESVDGWGIVIGVVMAPNNPSILRSPHSSFLAGPPQPLVVTLEGRGHENPLDLYTRIASPSQPSFLLESGRCNLRNNARYSFLGACPAKIVSHDRTSASFSHDPFASLKQELGDQYMHAPSGFPPFFGGAVGYFSYDLARRFEPLSSGPANDLRIPEFQFGLFDVIIAIDHLVGRTHMIYCPSSGRFLSEPRDKLYREGLDRLEECEARLTRGGHSKSAGHSISFAPEQTREAYLDRVSRCQDYIQAGDIYQANLSHRFSFSIPDAYQHGIERLQYEQSLYRQLQTVNPSPFSGLLHFEDVSLISCSPERLVRLRGRRTDTRPIAGTRPRGLNTADDRRLVGDLLANEKERAEHVMLIDLERNDLGRVCEFGSVHVDELMTIEQYSHVSHIVSNISGRLRPDATPFDLIRAVFPGGTITGVPKIRCMAIIDELEPVRRGPYTGSFGYIGWNGNLDLNIIIRTLVMTGERGYLQVGAGIVADSDPAREYEETLHKAQAFFRSFQD